MVDIHVLLFETTSNPLIPRGRQTLSLWAFKQQQQQKAIKSYYVLLTSPVPAFQYSPFINNSSPSDINTKIILQVQLISDLG